MGNQDISDTLLHRPVTTLVELDALCDQEVFEGYSSTNRGDPEPRTNRSRAFYHGWRVRMMDLREIEVPPEHANLVRQWVHRERARKMQ